jgi:hypothetical protein
LRLSRSTPESDVIGIRDVSITQETLRDLESDDYIIQEITKFLEVLC